MALWCIMVITNLATERSSLPFRRVEHATMPRCHVSNPHPKHWLHKAALRAQMKPYLFMIRPSMEFLELRNLKIEKSQEKKDEKKKTVHDPHSRAPQAQLDPRLAPGNWIARPVTPVPFHGANPAGTRKNDWKNLQEASFSGLIYHIKLLPFFRSSWPCLFQLQLWSILSIPPPNCWNPTVAFSRLSTPMRLFFLGATFRWNSSGGDPPPWAPWAPWAPWTLRCPRLEARWPTSLLIWGFP